MSLKNQTQGVKKQDLVDAVFATPNLGLTKTQLNTVISALFSTITTFLVEGKAVPIAGFGKFSPIQRKARNGINPATQAPLKIAASVSLGFKISSSLKELLNAKTKK